MIVTDKGIILIHDEVIGSSVAGKKVVVPHSYMHRVIERAKSVCYDATSENAVKAVLSCHRTNKIFYPFMKLAREAVVIAGMDDLFLESESVNFAKHEPYKPKTETEKIISLCINRYIVATRHEVWRSMIPTDTVKLVIVPANESNLGIEMLFTSRRELTIRDTTKLSDSLWKIGWVIQDIKDGSITVIPSEDKRDMKDVAKAVDITKKIITEIKHALIMYDDGIKTIHF